MLTVDGISIPAEGSVLDACRAAGKEIPAFCHCDGLKPGGHCRACLVEADGRCVAACVTPAREGMTIRTDTERLRAYRRDLGELMRRESSPGGEAGRILETWGVDGSRYDFAGTEARATDETPLNRKSKIENRKLADRSHPYVHLDLGACILCRRCVRACEQVQGQFVYAVQGRGAEAHLAWGSGAFAESPCVSCGACIAICPTGALTDADRAKPLLPSQESGRVSHGSGGERAQPPARAVAGPTHAVKTVRTTCGYCGVGCQMNVHAAKDDILRIDGVESPVNHGHLCVKGRYAHGFARHPDRLTAPLARRNGALVPVSWDEAISLVATRLTGLRGKLAGLSSSRCTNEENYLFQKWFRAGLGTNNVDCCARVCHAPTATGMRAAFGTGAATNRFQDIERADMFLVVGSNATEAHPVIGARIKQAVLQGAKLVVADVRKTELAAMADIHLQLRPGTNVPLLNALACVLVEEGLVNRDFLANRAEGWEEFQTFIRRQTPESVEAVTRVPAALIRSAARLYGSAERAMMFHGLGVSEHYQGSEAVMLLCNLALLTGAVGRPGVGVNPLRGQNNVQGASDMGCQPDLLTGYLPVADPAVRSRFAEIWGRPVPETPGLMLPGILEGALRGDIRGMFILGEDIVQTDPDSGRTRRALESLEFLVVQELFLSETARLADVVLPGASVFEKDGTFTNAERRIQRVRKALDPPGQARADWEILLQLMAQTGCPQEFQSPAGVMEEIARMAPAFAGVSYARLDGDGLQWPVPDASHPGTPILHTTAFPGGRGKLTCVEYVPSPQLGDGLTLTTGRVLEHYNAGTMTRRTDNVRLCGQDELEIHPRDAEARGIADGDRVIVTSAYGEVNIVARVTNRVAPGVLFMSFHFPETDANAVTSDVVDRKAFCPEYKVTAVNVRHS